MKRLSSHRDWLASKAPIRLEYGVLTASQICSKLLRSPLLANFTFSGLSFHTQDELKTARLAESCLSLHLNLWHRAHRLWWFESALQRSSRHCSRSCTPRCHGSLGRESRASDEVCHLWQSCSCWDFVSLRQCQHKMDRATLTALCSYQGCYWQVGTACFSLFAFPRSRF